MRGGSFFYDIARTALIIIAMGAGTVVFIVSMAIISERAAAARRFRDAKHPEPDIAAIFGDVIEFPREAMRAPGSPETRAGGGSSYDAPRRCTHHNKSAPTS
jgi:hypothetical protein